VRHERQYRRPSLSRRGVLFILALRGLSHPGDHVAAGQSLRHDRHGDRHRTTLLLAAGGCIWAGLLVIGGIGIGGGIGA
jgi:NAD(P) transhydrogenase subunit beta